eukprot:COSAG06_NODE_47401_length_339_cov_1.016667_1_plen_23_part_01
MYLWWHLPYCPAYTAVILRCTHL